LANIGKLWQKIGKLWQKIGKLWQKIGKLWQKMVNFCKIGAAVLVRCHFDRDQAKSLSPSPNFAAR
jgi:hypothetical protein